MNAEASSELLKVLCCPRCHGAIMARGEQLGCTSCGQEYPVRDGIPDMRVHESAAYENAFNKEQACHEAEVHDKRAETGYYENTVIRLFGTKTRIMVENWALDLDAPPTATGLDYGCGTGQVSRVMSRHIKPFFAFDISEKSLRKCVQENPAIIGVLANAFCLPFTTGAFTAVFVNGVLHHIVDLQRAAAELARVCTGTVYVSEGIPRGLPSLRTLWSYPGCRRKLAFLCYLAFYWPPLAVKSVLRLLARPFRRRRPRGPACPDSKYERALEAGVVESFMRAHGFARSRLRYYTNIDIPGDGPIKNRLTRTLVNDVVGTHFDLRMDRTNDGNVPAGSAR